MPKVYAILAMLLLGGTLTGCNTVNGLRDPQAEVTALALQQQTEYGARFDIVLTVSNPNDVPLPLRKASYSVDVEGVGSFQFEDQPARTIPANGKQEVRLPAAIATKGGEIAGTAATASGSITYEPPGEIRKLLTDAKVPLPSVSFASRQDLRASAAE